MILQTTRLSLRQMTNADYPALSKILQDEDVMYAYNGAFSDVETQAWLDRQLERYAKFGFGLWAVELKETGEMIGQCGLTMQRWKAETVLEVGYLFQKAYWHKGYASEAAAACRDYAFLELGTDKVYSIIRDSNLASQNVAKRNGMSLKDTGLIKHYRGADMPHLLFCVERKA